MSNSLKGITAKISNWILPQKQTFPIKENEPLTYAEYKSRVQLSKFNVSISTSNRKGNEPGNYTGIVSVNPDKGPLSPNTSLIIHTA